MTRWHKDLSGGDLDLQDRKHKNKYQCIHCGEEFRTYGNAKSHMNKHQEIPLKDRDNNRTDKWKKHFIKLC